MIRNILILIICFGLFSNKTPQPNIIFILADDLGYGEVGYNGQKLIETPNIDALAKSGKIFSQHYAGAPVCAPSRCVLLTGRHLGNAYIRGNDEWAERGNVWSLSEMNKNPRLEGQRPLPDSIPLLTELLKKAGYTNGIFGKWGLGAPETNSVPTKRGFDEFYGYNCQRQAHTLYPEHLWHKEQKVKLKNKFVDLHKSLDATQDPYNPKSYADFALEDYAPALIHEKALAFIVQNKNSPFFLYYASPLPHVPLQAPQKWIEYYKKKLGEELPYIKGDYYPNQTPRATYAAMISYLDEQVGDIVNKLKKVGQYQNTIIIFTSDNGPSYAGGTQPDFFDSAAPFLANYGRGKGFVYEGGLRVPTVVSWPGKIKSNSVSDHISAFYDFLPTFCDLLSISKPKTDGISFLPEWLGKKQKKHDFLYWEFPETGGQQAIRMGNWKAVRTELHKGIIKTQLYDLNTDLKEQKDVSLENPEVLAKIEEIFLREHTTSLIPKFRIKVLDN
jgi:arylsulfatase A-like enzyme